jgi:hypothetical protein
VFWNPLLKECLINLHSSYADFFPYFYEFSLLNSKTKSKVETRSKTLLFVRSILDTEREE